MMACLFTDVKEVRMAFDANEADLQAKIKVRMEGLLMEQLV